MNEILTCYKDQYVNLPNIIIHAKEKKTNLLESKVEVLAISKRRECLKARQKIDSEGNPYQVNYVEIRASEVKLLSQRTDGTIYNDIRKIAISLKQKISLFEDRKTGSYIVKSLYGDVEYINGKGLLLIEFNPEMEHVFNSLADGYTKIGLPILFSYKSVGGFELYKLLKSYAFNLPPITDMSLPQEELPSYMVEYSYDKLRLELGFTDISDKNINLEARKKTPDYEKMVNLEKKPKYRAYADFQRRVLIPGKEEINDIGDIYISDIQKVGSGRGGKITSIRFIIQRNKKFYKDTSYSPDEETMNSVEISEGISVENFKTDYSLSKISEVLEIFDGISINEKDANVLLNEAKGNIDRIRDVYELSKKQASISNLIGWLRTALREDFQEGIPTMEGDEQKGRDARILEKERNSASEEEKRKIQQRIWEKSKEKEDFADFLNFVGYEIEILEEMFEVEELVQMYFDFRRNSLNV